MISTIKRYHLGSSPYTLKYDSNSRQISIENGTSTIKIGRDDLKIEPISIKYNNVINSSSPSNRQNLNVQVNDTSKSVQISFTITNIQGGQTFDVDTIIKRY